MAEDIGMEKTTLQHTLHFRWKGTTPGSGVKETASRYRDLQGFVIEHILYLIP